MLSKLLHLSNADRLLLAQTLLLLGSIRIGLRLLPFTCLVRTLDRLTPRNEQRGQRRMTSADVVWAVDVISRHFPWCGTCLTRALAARILLARRGYQTELHIGVARQGDELKAHAWLESSGDVTLGSLEASSSEFVPLYPTIRDVVNKTTPGCPGTAAGHRRQGHS